MAAIYHVSPICDTREALKTAGRYDDRATRGTMAASVPYAPVLSRFRTALDDMYGDRLERVVLFGSRARGDARPDSDYDVAVFLRDMEDRHPELRRLADLSTDFIAETGEFVHAMPYRAGAYNERTPLMLGIRNDGVDL